MNSSLDNVAEIHQSFQDLMGFQMLGFSLLTGRKMRRKNRWMSTIGQFALPDLFSLLMHTGLHETAGMIRYVSSCGMDADSRQGLILQDVRNVMSFLN